MKHISLVGFAVFASITAMAGTASARLGVAPISSEKATLQDDAFIQVRGGHGHGHMGRGGRGHHYGWGRGRGHHYGWRHHRRHW
jgi:hypothetical protein